MAWLAGADMIGAAMAIAPVDLFVKVSLVGTLAWSCVWGGSEVAGGMGADVFELVLSCGLIELWAVAGRLVSR